MIKLKDILKEVTAISTGLAQNDAMYTPPGKQKFLHPFDLAGYTQIEFPEANDIYGEFTKTGTTGKLSVNKKEVSAQVKQAVWKVTNPTEPKMTVGPEDMSNTEIMKSEKEPEKIKKITKNTKLRNVVHQESVIMKKTELKKIIHEEIRNILKESERPLNIIAREIKTDWKNLSPYAKPYLEAMETLRSIDDDYYMDSGYSVVAYFLSSAGTWKGEKAKEIKKELNIMLKKRSG